MTQASGHMHGLLLACWDCKPRKPLQVHRRMMTRTHHVLSGKVHSTHTSSYMLWKAALLPSAWNDLLHRSIRAHSCSALLEVFDSNRLVTCIWSVYISLSPHGGSGAFSAPNWLEEVWNFYSSSFHPQILYWTELWAICQSPALYQNTCSK